LTKIGNPLALNKCFDKVLVKTRTILTKLSKWETLWDLFWYRIDKKMISFIQALLLRSNTYSFEQTQINNSCNLILRMNII